MPADTVVMGGIYQLEGRNRSQKVYVYVATTATDGKYAAPLELKVGRWVQVVSGPHEPGQGVDEVNVNLRGQFYRVYVLKGTAVVKEGYVPASLFESGRFVLDGR